MSWLCSVSLAASQLAYAARSPELQFGDPIPQHPTKSHSIPCEALGVLGCLYTTDVERSLSRRWRIRLRTSTDVSSESA